MRITTCEGSLKEYGEVKMSTEQLSVEASNKTKSRSHSAQ